MAASIEELLYNKKNIRVFVIDPSHMTKTFVTSDIPIEICTLKGHLEVAAHLPKLKIDLCILIPLERLQGKIDANRELVVRRKES